MKVLQISDMHIFDNPEDKLLGVPTTKSFEAIIDLIRIEESNEKTDLILLTGDLSQDGSASSYQRIAEMLKPSGVPIYFVPGNHDNQAVINQVYPTQHILENRRIVLPQWQFILLNSQIEGQVRGSLAPSELDFMQNCLIDYPDRHAIIVFHHQPVPVGSTWLDKQGLTNGKEFWEVAAKYSNIHTVLFGHVHQEFQEIFNGIRCISAPSTSIQFKPNQADFGLDNQAPGYRWIKLFDDGVILTGVKRWAYYIGDYLANAKGY